MKKSLLLGAVCACLHSLIPLSAHAIPVSGQGTWETTLLARDVDGDTNTIEAYYDTVLDITWTANANLAASNTFGLPYNTDLGDYPGNSDGRSYPGKIWWFGAMNWSGAHHWIDAMNADGGTGYLGYNNWRLPTMMDTGTPGCNYAYTGTDCGYNVQTGSAATMVYSEMASLWYDTLGNLAVHDTSGNYKPPGWGLTNTGPFSNVQGVYWTGLEHADSLYPVGGRVWVFITSEGSQNWWPKFDMESAWAVRDGDIATVPEPPMLLLIATGLIGLIGRARLSSA